MTTVLVNSNVILDITTADPEWHDWSSTTLSRCADEAYLAINPIIYAEVVVKPKLDMQYKRMAEDEKREAEALEWAEATLQDAHS